MQPSTRLKILFVDAGFLTTLFHSDKLDFNWDCFAQGETHPYDMVATFISNPDGKPAFTKYVSSRDIKVNDSGILLTEFLLQTHIRAQETLWEGQGFRLEYTVIGNDERMIKVLHPMLDISQNDTLTMHHAWTREEVQPYIDRAPKNVYWHAIDCLEAYFKEKR